MNSAHRVVVHLDMDAFFASVEQRDVPTLRGMPVIVGGEREGRGIVSAASYEARKFGIHSAMSMRQARMRCPHALFLEGNWAKYVTASLEVFATCRSASPWCEIVSVDECTLWFDQPWDEVAVRARALAEDVERIHGLSCSIGIAPNRLLAKLASSLEKPHGFTMLHPRDLPHSISALPPSSVWGIGPKTASILESEGIRTIGDLLQRDPAWLKKNMGDRALTLVQALRGAPDGVDPPVKERSLGHEYTFGSDVVEGPRFWGVVARLCDQVSRRLRLNGLQGSIVRVRVRWSNFTTRSHQATVRTDLHDPLLLRDIARRLLKVLLIPRRKMRLVGVTAAGLFADPSLSCDEALFPPLRRASRLTRAVDAVWDRYGEDSLVRASSLL